MRLTVEDAPKFFPKVLKMRVWQPIADADSGILFSLSEALAQLETNQRQVLTPVNVGTQVVASDYSGQHKGASHEAYSFLVTTQDSVGDWLPLRALFRRTWLPDGRRISFKQMKEGMRWRAMPAFLAAANALKGNLITVLVSQNIGSFIDGGPLAALEVFPDCFPDGTRHGTIDKIFRLASFVAFIQAGLRNESQGSIWISDSDETLDSFQKREGFARLATYITVGLTKWSDAADMLFGTTGANNLPEWAEDLAAIPDLVAGSYCKLASSMPTFVGKPSWQERLSPMDVEDQRARVVGTWLAGGGGKLRHVLLRLERDENGDIRVSAQALSLARI